MENKRKKCILAYLLIGAMIIMNHSVSLAYFERGNVGVSVGKQSVVLEQGKSEAVSVSFSPAQSNQLPGCGMAECPQICGEKDCLDANGECKCAGTTYQTYYAFASVSSSNTSVATASYNSGRVVTINAIAPGTATITVTASLRQYTSTSTTIQVTVKAKEATVETPPKNPDSGNDKNTSSGNTSLENNDKVNNDKTNNDKVNNDNTNNNKANKYPESNSSSEATSSSVSVRPVTEQKENSKKETQIEQKEKSANNTVIESDRGKITFVSITDDACGKAELQQILGKKEFVDFQKKDEAGTILYAWEFCGTDLKEVRNLNLNLEISQKQFTNCDYGTASNSIYMERAEKDALPGAVTTYIRVNEWFQETSPLNLYSFDIENGIVLLEENLKVENGYITCSAMNGEDVYYILSTEQWDTQKNVDDETKSKDTSESDDIKKNTEIENEAGFSSIALAVIAGMAVLLVGVYFGVYKKNVENNTEKNIQNAAENNIEENLENMTEDKSKDS